VTTRPVGIAIDLTELHTPIGLCVVTPSGPIQRDVLEKLEVAGYDQAPVINDSRRVVGLVNTTRLQELLALGRPLTPNDEALYRAVVDRETTVEKLLDVLAASRAALVVQADSESPVGLVTISDLNRHTFRRVVYGVIAELEDRVARLIEARFSDFWEWLHKLGEEHQIRLLGYVEVTRRRGVDIGPIAACTLTQLLRVVGSFPDLRGRLGSESRTKWDGLVGPIIDLRNRVMHPARPMVLGADDVKRIQAAARSLMEVHTRVRAGDVD
jgi:CBS domain-containing protein